MPHSPHERLDALLASDRARLLAHPVYANLSSRHSVARFMEAHVFAVWDFMTLLKSLQRRFTCVEVPWHPRPDATLARLINDIVLGEECDEVRPGDVVSHLELYLQAMDEVGADRRPMDSFLSALARGDDALEALTALPVLAEVKAFVRHTLQAAQADDASVVAAFLYGREDVIPDMFRRILATLRAAHVPCVRFALYLERHIEVDDGHHAPLARRMMDHVCGDDTAAFQRTLDAAQRAIRARESLWDGTFNSLSRSDNAAT